MPRRYKPPLFFRGWKAPIFGMKARTSKNTFDNRPFTSYGYSIMSGKVYEAARDDGLAQIYQGRFKIRRKK